MSIKNEGAAGWAVHPGEILREEFLEPMGISAYRLSVEGASKFNSSEYKKSDCRETCLIWSDC